MKQDGEAYMNVVHANVYLYCCPIWHERFAALGFDKIFPVSAIHGLGIERLMNDAAEMLPPLPVDDASAWFLACELELEYVAMETRLVNTATAAG